MKHIDPYWHDHNPDLDGNCVVDGTEYSCNWKSRIRRAAETVLIHRPKTTVATHGEGQAPDIIALQEVSEIYEGDLGYTCDTDDLWNHASCEEGRWACLWLSCAHDHPRTTPRMVLEHFVEALNAQADALGLAVNYAVGASAYGHATEEKVDRLTSSGDAIVYNTRRLAPSTEVIRAGCTDAMNTYGDAPTFCLTASGERVGVGSRLRLRVRDERDKLIESNLVVGDKDQSLPLPQAYHLTAFSVHLAFDSSDEPTVVHRSGDLGARQIGEAVAFLQDVFRPALFDLGQAELPPVLMGDFNINSAVMLSIEDEVQRTMNGIGDPKFFMPPFMLDERGFPLTAEHPTRHQQAPIMLHNFPPPDPEVPPVLGTTFVGPNLCVHEMIGHDNSPEGERSVQEQFEASITNYLCHHSCAGLPWITRAMIGEALCTAINDAAHCGIVNDLGVNERQVLIDQAIEEYRIVAGTTGDIDHIKVGMPELINWTSSMPYQRVGYWTSSCHQEDWRPRAEGRLEGDERREHWGATPTGTIRSFSDHPIVMESIRPQFVAWFD